MCNSIHALQARNCANCGVDIRKRDLSAKFCFECMYSKPKRTGGYLAHKAVNRAVSTGELPKASTLACVDCGVQARDYDHRDYNKPLDVVPVCRRCNKMRGSAIPVEQAAA
jgi:hypothetical protein